MFRDPIENLANAIIEQAVIDYRKIPIRRQRLQTKLRKAEERLERAMATKDQERIDRATRCRDSLKGKVTLVDADQRSIERFFHSEWYRMLTKIDGDMILQALREEQK